MAVGSPAAFASSAPQAVQATVNDHGGGGQGPVKPATSGKGKSSLAAVDVTITREEVIARAKTWVGQGLQYDWGGSHQGYRTDCSGFVSMAWGLGSSQVTNTFVPNGYAKWISKGDLKPGDALLNDNPGASGHVTLFEKWTDSSKSEYWGFEFTPSGVHHRKIPYPYFSGRGTFKPVRYVNIQDESQASKTRDLTGDGMADLAVYEPDGTITMGRGFGDGFTDYHTITEGFGGYDGRLQF
ncbi:NlpC/P60 family protein, partial [Streptomyces sp. NPDC017260]